MGRRTLVETPSESINTAVVGVLGEADEVEVTVEVRDGSSRSYLGTLVEAQSEPIKTEVVGALGRDRRGRSYR